MRASQKSNKLHKFNRPKRQIRQPASRSSSFNLPGNKANLAGFVSLSLFGIIGFAALSPVSISSSSALQNTTETLETTATVKAAASLAVSLTPLVEIDSMPTSSGTFSAGEAILNVSTNNLRGYSVYINTKDQTTSMVKENPSTVEENLYQIKTLASPSISSGFDANTWGYSLAATAMNDNTTFQPISAQDQPVLAGGGSMMTNGDTYHLTFGTKVDQTLPAGQYTNHVSVSVIANPLEITKLSELIYMQDMTSDICRNTGEITVGSEITKQLVDIRDGKKYWVAKLADQNCWMTQNLALDLEEGKTLTSSDTDLNSKTSWSVISESAYYDRLNETQDETTKKQLANDYAASTSTTIPPTDSDPIRSWTTRSWNLGQYVYATPTNEKICGNIASGSTLDQCSTFQNISDNWSPTFDARTEGQAGVWTGNTSRDWGTEAEYSGHVSANKDEKRYDAHYLIGNYYQWNTAVAGSGNGLKEVDATDSICPSGWQLPKAGIVDDTTPADREDSVYALLHVYGYPNNTEYGKGNNYSAGGYTPIINSANQNFLQSPFYFNESGTAFIDEGTLRFAGQMSYFWGATAASTVTSAHATIAYNSGIYPSGMLSRWYGLPVRCLAR